MIVRGLSVDLVRRSHFLGGTYLRLIMIEGESPVFQALLGTLLTWALTLAGAAMALFLQVFYREE